MSSISTRIRELRQSADMTQEEFGNKFGIVKSTVSLYESGKSTPNDEIKQKICEFFDISLDYLLGREENPQGWSSVFFDQELKIVFQIRLKNAIQKSALSKSELCQKASIDIGDLEKYLSAELKPSIEDLLSLSKALSVTTDYLLGQISDKAQNLLQSFSHLNEDYQDIVIGETKKALRDQKRDEAVAADSSLKEAK